MSYSPSYPSPGPPLSRASLVIGLYGAMALVALVIAAGRGDPDLYQLRAASYWPLLTGPLAVDILRTHPVAIIGGVLIENSFFSRPEDFLREVRSRTGPMQAYRS